MMRLNDVAPYDWDKVRYVNSDIPVKTANDNFVNDDQVYISRLRQALFEIIQTFNESVEFDHEGTITIERGEVGALLKAIDQGQWELDNANP